MNNGFHSNDFNGFGLRTEKIDERTREEWEQEFGIVGLVNHLSGLGWSRYQWRFVPPEKQAASKAAFEAKHGKAPRREFECFAEFFSPYFHGYLRGDGPTVREAVEECVNTAQRYATCGNTTGHAYVPYKHGGKGEEYTNGLIMCRHCGFCGHTTLIEAMKTENENLRLYLNIEQERCAERVRYAEENGESWEEGFRRNIKAVGEDIMKSAGLP